MKGARTDFTGELPDRGDLETIYKAHHSYYEPQRGDTALQQRGDEEGILRAHAGRVVFELLQNALDRAASKITINVLETPQSTTPHALVVTNDGASISVDRDYDYKNPPQKQNRPDFNALCSVHLSNKSPDESVGNKGVGFRSVFWLHDWVRVWSRFDAGWWGMELHSPLDDETWEARLADEDLRRGHETFLDRTDPTYSDIGTRPSYHFPLPLMNDKPPSLIPEGEVTTAVIVPIPSDQLNQVSKMIGNLAESHLNFVGVFEDRRGLEVEVETPKRCFERPTWPTNSETGVDSRQHIIYWKSNPESPSSLEQEAHEAGFDCTKPGAAIKWPENTDEDVDGQLYGYLPTELDAPFGVDFNGDFLLQPDRKGLTVGNDSVGQYNQSLLEAGAELHLLEILEEVGIQSNTVDWTRIDPDAVECVDGQQSDSIRRDFWSLLEPGASGIPARKIEKHFATLLFGDDLANRESYSLWAKIADEYFRNQDSVQRKECKRFWEVSKSWLDYHCGKGCGSVTLGKYADAICNALRDQETALIPVESSGGTSRRVPLPTKQSNREVSATEKSDQVLFVRDNEDDRSLPLPTALRTAGCSVTTFNFPSLFTGNDSSPLGEKSFNPVEILSEVRQLPNSLSNYEYQPLADGVERAANLQQKLIRYVVDLFLYDRYHDGPLAEEDYEVGWRFLSGEWKKNEQDAGKSISTLYLPTETKMWAPARQLTIDEVDIDRLGELPPSLDIESFLLFLGCGTEPPEEGIPLTVIEGGKEAVVEPQSAPPTIVQAGRGVSLPAIPQLSKASIEDDRPAAAWPVSIADAWDRWLADLIAQEVAERRSNDGSSQASTNLRAPLTNRAWFPVDTDPESTGEPTSHAKPPQYLSDVPSRITPQKVVVLPKRSYGRKRILWSIDQGSKYDGILTTLGALDGISEESLRSDDAAPSYRIFDQLRRLNLVRIQGDTSARDALLGIYERALQAVIATNSFESVTDVPPLLMYSPASTSVSLHERSLKWCQLSDSDAYIITDSDDREQMRRIFPSVPFVTAVVKKQSVNDSSPLQSRLLSVNRQVQFKESDTDSGDLVSDTRVTFEGLIPRLLALSEVVRRIEIDNDTISRWHEGQLQQVEDAWIEYSVSADGRELDSKERHRDEMGYAFFVDTDTPMIVFDQTLGETSVTPFGEALADLLFEDQRQVGILFERALTEYDQGGDSGLDSFLHRKDATLLVNQYSQMLHPLGETTTRELLESTKEVLSEFDLTLDSSIDSPNQLVSLGPSDVTIGENFEPTRDVEINRRLQELELTEEQDRFRPRFACADDHRRLWEDWFNDFQPPLVSYLVDLVSSNGIEDANEDTVKSHLEEFIGSAVHQISFDPSEAVISWLSESKYTSLLPDAAIPDSDCLADEIRRFSPRFDSVSSIEDASNAGWTRDGPDGPEGHPKDNGTYDRRAMDRKRKAQKVVGDEAEEALLDCILSDTLSALEHAKDSESYENAKKALLSPFPEGVTRSSLFEAWNDWQKTGDSSTLARGLHISQVWDGAGFDFVGLNYGADGFQPVRYEAKALSGGSESNIHLSANQISVYRRVCLQPDPEEAHRYRGDWRLIGVLPDGSAINLNGQLKELPEILDDLDTSGFTHDGIVLRLNRTIDH